MKLYEVVLQPWLGLVYQMFIDEKPEWWEQAMFWHVNNNNRTSNNIKSLYTT